MVKVWIDEENRAAADINVSIGGDDPDTEQEWINAILGLPAGFKEGDALPAELAAELQAIKAKKESDALAAESKPELTSATSAAPTEKDWTKEPPRFTREWIDFMESEPNHSGWNWRKYLSALRREAREGHQSAKEELEAFRANGVNLNGGALALRAEPKPRQQANLVKRQAKRERREAQRLQKGKAAAEIRQLEEESRPFYNDLVCIFWDTVPHQIADVRVFIERLEAEGKQGKVKRFQPYLDRLHDWIVKLPSFENFCTQRSMLGYRDSMKDCQSEFTEVFYSREWQKQEGNLDGEFYKLCFPIIRGYFDAYLAAGMRELDAYKKANQR